MHFHLLGKRAENGTSVLHLIHEHYLSHHCENLLYTFLRHYSRKIIIIFPPKKSKSSVLKIESSSRLFSKQPPFLVKSCIKLRVRYVSQLLTFATRTIFDDRYSADGKENERPTGRGEGVYFTRECLAEV